MIYESDQEGVLQILAEEGDTLAVGALIAHVGEAAAPPTHASSRRAGRSSRGGATSRQQRNAAPRPDSGRRGALRRQSRCDMEARIA